MLPPLTRLLRTVVARQNGLSYAAHVSEAWMQGRTTYGGCSTALCLEGARRLLPEAPPLRSAQIML